MTIMNNNCEMSEEEFGEALKEDLEKKKYKLGSNFDWFIENPITMGIIFEFIRDDHVQERFSDVDCMAELRRLCEPSIRHYLDCVCPICRC